MAPPKGFIPWNKGLKGLHISPNTEFKKGMRSLRKGIILSEEIKKKISNSKKGQIPWNKNLKKTYKLGPCSEETKIKIGLANTGKIRSLETRKKLSASHRGISIEEIGDLIEVFRYSREFYSKREFVKKRDNYTCQLCGIQNVIFDIHHIDYNKNNNSLDNLITLCHSCHSKTNKDRNQWLTHFQNKLLEVN